jgi:small subunit ribosomal protein S6
MNVETDQKSLGELTGAFRFSDAVLRHLVVKMDGPVTEPSPMARAAEEDVAEGVDRPRRPRREEAVGDFDSSDNA